MRCKRGVGVGGGGRDGQGDNNCPGTDPVEPNVCRCVGLEQELTARRTGPESRSVFPGTITTSRNLLAAFTAAGKSHNCPSSSSPR